MNAPTERDALLAAKTKEAFRTCFKRQLILSVVLLPAVFVLVFADLHKAKAIAGIPVTTLIPAVVVLIIGGVAFSFWNWRCPACRKYLGKTMYPKHCSHCGVQLHD